MDKLYVIKKYVYAKNAKEAMLREKYSSVDDIWIDDDWKKINMVDKKPIGYSNKKTPVKKS
jgi:hypothetical protein